MIKKIALSLVVVSFMSVPALAYCSYLPNKPFSVSKPIKPFCIGYSGDTSMCSNWELSQYNNDVAAYNRYLQKMKEYISVVKCLYNEAVNQLNNGY